MTSILKVDTIQKADGSAATPTSLGIAPSGSILQVVSHIETGFTTFTHNSTSREDRLLLASNAADSTSHVSASITPSSTSIEYLQERLPKPIADLSTSIPIPSENSPLPSGSDLTFSTPCASNHEFITKGSLTEVQ